MCGVGRAATDLIRCGPKAGWGRQFFCGAGVVEGLQPTAVLRRYRTLRLDNGSAGEKPVAEGHDDTVVRHLHDVSGDHQIARQEAADDEILGRCSASLMTS